MNKSFRMLTHEERKIPTVNRARLSDKKEWRDLFDHIILKDAERLFYADRVIDMVADKNEAHAYVKVGAKSEYTVIKKAPTCYSMEWNPDWFICTCNSYRRNNYYYTKYRYSACVHAAALLLAWEKKHGPWEFTESDDEYEQRIREEEAEVEKERLRQLKEKEEKITVKVKDFLQEKGKVSGGTYFDIMTAVEKKNTSLYAVHLAEKLLENKDNIQLDPVETIYGISGKQQLNARVLINDKEDMGGWTSVSFMFGRQTIEKTGCSCHFSYYSYNPNEPLCAHQLVALLRIFDYVKKNDPGDATDKNADAFFKAMDMTGQVFMLEEDKTPVKKTENVVINPILNVEGGSVQLSFKIGNAGQKQLQLKKLELLAEAVQNEKTFEASKTVVLDFASQDVDEKSRPWLNFILQKVSDTYKVNTALESKSRWGYYYAPSISTQNKDELYGATLDRFYDIAEGTDCECVKKDMGAKQSSRMSIGHHNIRVKIETHPLKAANGDVIGIRVVGEMPIIRFGSSEGYVIGSDYVSRISKEEQQALYPFMKASNQAGKIDFNVGREKLAEFYYRVVPSIMEQPYVDFMDNCQSMVEGLMPPEPVFTFTLDAEEDFFTCREKVAYNGEETELPRPQSDKKGIDLVQEERAEKALTEYFPVYDHTRNLYKVKASEDTLFTILTEGIRKLSLFGEVLGSETFKKSRLRRTPVISVGVSVESGIMDISVISKDVDPAELLGILESYKLKKKYYRLKSGEYVDLSEGEQLDSLTDMGGRMNLPLETLIKEGVKVPAYRALYLNKLLEEREALVSERDKTYRTLIKNFQTIKDADYETPEGFKNVLRPYQEYGFKWLKTLASAGFGGILADEMGLGKTLQAISLMESLKNEGDSLPDLVVCPASLVYNWQEEIKRFAPKLKTSVLSGTAASRKEELKKLEKKNAKQHSDIYITSYDSLRKDITLYEKQTFNVVILDEAQYIKNQKAGITKSVKVLKGVHRFAMTGTPIENRLAELWSIFDFLMPGFLYGYSEFASRYETPIAKTKDPAAAENLKNMVRPFILRRLKTEVLKDLPDKLEEVRYIRFEEDQRKVYDGQVVKLRGIIENSSGDGDDKIRILAELTKLRQICCDPSLLFEDFQGESAKRKGCIELINSAISGGHRMLVFSQFTSMLELLEKDLKENGIEYYKITGSTPKEQRIRMVHDFNDGEVPVFLISLKAGGTGLNLTGADVVIHYDPWWNLAAQNQATDRAHRIGQKNTVTVYKMIIKDTIEEKILNLQEAKKDLADAILEGESKSLFALSGEELLGLLN